MTSGAEILRILTTEKFRCELEDRLVGLLAKHANKDLTVVEAVTILEIFRIGRFTIALLDKKGRASEQ